jgi:hypothetical protein
MSNRLTREELNELVRKILNCEGTEQELDEMVLVLRKNSPDPNILNLMYYPKNNISLSPEEIVDAALAYKPIAL